MPDEKMTEQVREMLEQIQELSEAIRQHAGLLKDSVDKLCELAPRALGIGAESLPTLGETWLRLLGLGPEEIKKWNDTLAQWKNFPLPESLVAAIRAVYDPPHLPDEDLDRENEPEGRAGLNR